MAGKLIMLPFRVWFRSARLITHVAGEAAGCAVALAGHTLGAVASNGSQNGHAAEWQQASPEQSPGWREEPIEEGIEEPVEEAIDEAIEEPVSPVEVEHPHDEADRPRQPRPAPAVQATAAPTVQQPPAPVAQEPPAPLVEEPVHVSEEPELVLESAEPGAEDGAGAELTVMEPWDGYARMSARDVIARARQASPAELAAVRLYEARQRSRQTVLAAVDRQLKLSGGSNPA